MSEKRQNELVYKDGYDDNNNEEDEECRRRLLDSNLSPNVSVVNETTTMVTGPTISSGKLRKKFLVTKLDEPSVRANEQSPSPSPPPPPPLAAAASTQDESSNTRIDSIVESLIDSPDLLSKAYEDDDLFESKEQLNENAIDNTFRMYRESEGQDTVTSLTNNIYRKQLENIRRKAILNRARTSAEANAKSRAGSVKSVSESSSGTTAKTSNEHLEILKSIIDSQESVISKKALAMFSSVEKAAVAAAVAAAAATPRHSLNREAGGGHAGGLERGRSVDSVMMSKARDDREQRLEMIRRAIEEDFERFASIYKQQQLDQKKKKDNAKRMCLFVEILVFVGVFMLTIVFTRTVLYHIEVIRRIPKHSAGPTSPALTNNLTLNFTNFTTTTTPTTTTTIVSTKFF